MKYGLLGANIEYSLSPIIHEFLGSYPYELCSMDENQAKDFLLARDFKGLNVTIPYKRLAMNYCDKLTPIAKAIGCVNTLYYSSGKLIGDNTDYYGFLYGLISNNIYVNGKIVCVFGTGATARTITKVLKDGSAGTPSEILYVSHSGKAAYDYSNIYDRKDIEIFVNATPQGTWPSKARFPLDLKRFPHLIGVVDVVYTPRMTDLLIQAKDLHINCTGGMPMLIAQAKASSERFQSQNLDISIPEMVEKVDKDNRNIVLIGMPGSGKTTLGAKLAKALNRQFIDTDHIVEKLFGISCEDFILQKGEQAFREAEAEVCKDLSSRKACIIATGGGLVTNEESMFYLRLNGLIVWVQRPLYDLDIRERPLSKHAISIDDLYKTREPLYSFYHGIKVNYNTSIDSLADSLGGI